MTSTVTPTGTGSTPIKFHPIAPAGAPSTSSASARTIRCARSSRRSPTARRPEATGRRSATITAATWIRKRSSASASPPLRRHSTPAATRRERDLTWNPRTLAELDQLAPRFSWNLLLSSEGVDAQEEFVVRELNAVQDLAQLFLKIPVDDWRAYFRYHYLADHAEVLPKAFDEERFDFYERTLRGQQAQKDRWKRAVDALDEDLGEAVGELYVQRYFPPASRQQVLALVENLRASYAAHIEQLPWMTPETRQVALEKLAAFHPKIGYPERWRDYSG